MSGTELAAATPPNQSQERSPRPICSWNKFLLLIERNGTRRIFRSTASRMISAGLLACCALPLSLRLPIALFTL